jgi:hypothetical protein
MMAARCRYCDAPMRWVDTEAGRRMPLDVEPRADGNVTIVSGLGHVLTAGEDAPAGQRWMPHFATCPNHPRRMHGRTQ